MNVSSLPFLPILNAAFVYRIAQKLIFTFDWKTSIYAPCTADAAAAASDDSWLIVKNR